jgi:hypothetical protein
MCTRRSFPLVKFVFWAEPIENGDPVEFGRELMRFYFMPEGDNQAALLIYEAVTLFLPPNE